MNKKSEIIKNYLKARGDLFSIKGKWISTDNSLYVKIHEEGGLYIGTDYNCAKEYEAEEDMFRCKWLSLEETKNLYEYLKGIFDEDNSTK